MGPVSSAIPSRRPATAADLQALAPEIHAEVIAGEIIEKASPSAEHAFVQATLTGEVVSRFGQGAGGHGGMAGWRILTEVEIELQQHEVFRPDIAGWRRDHHPQRPQGRPVRECPDWVCEITSPSHAQHDRVTKLRVYHRAGVPHYWILDPDEGILTVHRWQQDGYVVALAARRGETVRAQPFEAMELQITSLFGDDVNER